MHADGVIPAADEGLIRALGPGSAILFVVGLLRDPRRL
jgi:hypothetical protein